MSWFWFITLAALSIWDFFENKKRKKYADAYCSFGIPEAPTYTPSRVSIIIPTVNPGARFTDNLISIIRNRPSEIIIVTIPRWLPIVKSLVAPVLERAKNSGVAITVKTAAQANKRVQLIQGINHSKGDILALVDDDTLWKDGVLISLLAPFENHGVGLVGGPITSFVPVERQDANIITPWEVAAVRLRARRYDSAKAFFQADGGANFSVSGATMLCRREILVDPNFQKEFQEEEWRGIRHNTGDDSFITRWILFAHLQIKGRQWKLGMQLTPEAEVATGIEDNSGFMSQMKRWYRSGLRLRLQCLLYHPGFLEMYRTTPYMATKMAQGMLALPIFLVRVGALWCIRHALQPWGRLISVGYLMCHTWWYLASLRSFFKQFPWTQRHFYAAILVDWVYLVSDIYSYASLGVEEWSTRLQSGEEAIHL